MACRTCPECSVNYPPSEEHRVCPACGVYTTYQPHMVADPFWLTKAEAVAARIQALAMEELNEVPHVDALVTVDEEGLTWLSSHDAIRAGTTHFLHMAEHDIISIGPPDPSDNHPDDNLYEIVAYVDAKRAYWVRPLRVPDHA